MTEKEYRARARENLRGNWGLSIGVAAVVCILGGLISGSTFLGGLEWRTSDLETFQRWLSLLNPAASITGLLGLIQFVLGGVIQVGYARYLLDQHDHRELRLGTVFSAFDNFGTGFCQNFLQTLYIALWSILLVVPGIVAAYSYAMTPFLLAEHPDLTASQAIRASKDMMRGHKWELFCLDLTFLGWAILCALSANLGHVFLNPYRGAARAAFYRQISREQLGSPIFDV